MTDHSEPAESVLTFGSSEEALRVLGPGDRTIGFVESRLPGVVLTPRGESLRVSAPDAAALRRAEDLLGELRGVARRGTPVTEHLIGQVVSMLDARGDEPGAVPAPSEVLTTNILSSRGKSIRPKTLNQQRYVEAIDANTIVFGLGPAGTGKTYLAMAKAVQALQRKEVNRIILTRPAVEAGERLGYLPGTLSDKIDPYLRPLYDALHDMLDPESIPRLMEAGTIEVAPLAFMRGRTLNDAFIILDEAQNTTADQMKMFLTRLGFASKMVVTGDSSQVDLPTGSKSGLAVVESILDGVNDIDFVHLTAGDVVRHRLVSDIVNAYGVWDERGANGGRA
ncbi:PhoH family protein [Falsarthrobacter nasiphocae]|uniref:PhoH-like protein n=1 Tax=Falsarthrobacter nasiphocae TaxID=189863 RepID=A0AAE3YFP3_9MICC|nr:PhoH family protein [Falsarthrobacter nasiphocae]MDR6891073.1 phosphate starvation-inducible PhoH-like protein [Falsarthrobacter nasiphocae]